MSTVEGAHAHELEPEAEPGPGPEPTNSPRARSPRARRRERRREGALARAVAAARVAAPADALDDASRRDETLVEYLARVETPRLPRRARRTAPRLRRAAKVTLVIGLIAGCAVLPWAAPEVPRLFAHLVPDQSAAVPHVKDPPVEPAPKGLTGPVGIKQPSPYAGVRLQSAGRPREVRVPRLHVVSPVVPISGQSGTLVPPSDPQQLGWWREGKPVGAQYGTAVITGHTVHTGGGALDHLDKLVVGDSLRVRTDAGWIRYVVQRARIYSTDALARNAEKIFRLDGPGRLVVITCDDWNGEFYESNALVIATPVADRPFSS